MKNLEQIIQQLTELSKLLNKGTSLKLEVNGFTWFAVKNVEQFEKEIWQRNARRIEKEMFGDLACVGHEIVPPSPPLIAPQKPRHEEKTIDIKPSTFISKYGNGALDDFIKRNKLFYNKTRDKFEPKP